MAKDILLVLILPWVFAFAQSGVEATHAAAGVFGEKDKRPPSITLEGWAQTQIVFLDKAYVEGQVRDESNIESLTINQTPVLYRKGSRVFFSHMVDLKEGENVLTIEARDEAGNRAQRQMAVTRRAPKPVQLAERLSLAVLPFEHKGAVSEASLAFQDNLIDALVHRNRFQVIERDRLDPILKEQRLSRTKLFDKTTALKLGRLAVARSVITGSIVQTPHGIEIEAQMTDTETQEIISVQNVRGQGEDLPALRDLADGMAVKFHRDFPLVDGLVVEQKDHEILINLGQDVIKPQRRVIVFREEPVRHPRTGKVLGADNIILGRARITKVMPHTSTAELLDVAPGAVAPLDRIVTE